MRFAKYSLIVIPIAIILVLLTHDKNSNSGNANSQPGPRSAPITPRPAMFWQKLEGNLIQCRLCPNYCVLRPGERGRCRVRENRDGKLVTLVHGLPCAVHIDPIEKKPLFHFIPSTEVFSIATAGCNLRCKFCQNWQISQVSPEETYNYNLSAEELIRIAKERKCPSIAYTYTEPVIFYEYMLEAAKLAREAGIKNTMHSNGYINPEPLRELCKYLDAANIDLKGFTEEYYQEVCEGHLAPVLQTLKILKEEGVWLEITNLIVPTKNDDPETIRKMCIWIRDSLGADVPIHFSRFWPMYKLKNLPPTPVGTLERARKIAMDVGLHYVYIGNVPGHVGENTYCPKCGKVLIKRIGYHILENNIVNGKCKFCGQPIPGVWK
ncbi:MAG TPA: AmmeMemoRadiSam system radical SAM enzyme [bacterium (Candidatus Stahlbacteria)]|nr:AmmeMemoRadiSam system radical SAM enzyme [Candidatus Stahlbacteria bacterium]